ncbi:MAG: hypothetical protein U0637_03965 [Phycisphaerales bacterium]
MKISTASVTVLAGLAFASVAIAQDAKPEAAPAAQDTTFIEGNPGFLNGLRGFENFYNPVGQPIYFESPFNYSGLRFLFLHHEFSDGSQLAGGDVNIVAVQARLAITERLGFIATKDGFSWLDAGALPKDEGWNQLAAGLKYAFYVDKDQELVATGGARLMLVTGEDKVLQSDTEEISPFISVAKGFDKFHVIADLTYRMPFDGDKGNDVAMWDIHADYEVAENFAPMVELHGCHYLSDGTRLPLSVGGLDYSNLGSADVSGSCVIWAGVGARYKFNQHASVGATYEMALTDKDADIMDNRITVDFELNW